MPWVSETDTVAFRSTKVPTIMRSPAVTLPGNVWLAVWPPVWAVDVLCTNVILVELEVMVTVRMALPVPPPLVALSVTVELPAAVGVPEIRPVAGFTVRPPGNPVAP